jgi:hypothetical protein
VRVLRKFLVIKAFRKIYRSFVDATTTVPCSTYVHDVKMSVPMNKGATSKCNGQRVKSPYILRSTPLSAHFILPGLAILSWGKIYDYKNRTTTAKK